MVSSHPLSGHQNHFIILCLPYVPFLWLKQIDPFLQLVEDRKLRAVNSGSNSNAYGSKEDNSSAVKSLSEIVITEDQTREYFASEILKSLEISSNVKFLTFDIKICNTETAFYKF